MRVANLVKSIVGSEAAKDPFSDTLSAQLFPFCKLSAPLVSLETFCNLSLVLDSHDSCEPSEGSHLPYQLWDIAMTSESELLTLTLLQIAQES
jgi:hypothetical protein